MRRVRSKVCGLRGLADVQACISGGADAIGLVFHASSPRHVTIEEAVVLSHAASPFVTVVGLFVDAPLDQVRETARSCRLNVIQLHGEESPEYCSALRNDYPVLKAARLRDQDSVLALGRYHDCVDALLLDAYVAGQAGGTGHSFDWSWFNAARESVDEPLILAGGLTPDNVAAAIARTHPYAVDVSSGVESEPGIKVPSKILRFLMNLQGATR